jgi:hypothetical protein
MDKCKENGILLVSRNVLKCGEEVNDLKKEVELYNDIYREISEIVGLEDTLKLYLRFKGQQVSKKRTTNCLMKLSQNLTQSKNAKTAASKTTTKKSVMENRKKLSMK